MKCPKCGREKDCDLMTGEAHCQCEYIEPWTKEQIIEALKLEKFSLTDVIDAVIEINGMVGVGLITLGENLREYCYNKIKPL